jgi:hypothetical protein
MEARKTQPPNRKALKAKYLECLRARSPLALRQTVQCLSRLGVRPRRPGAGGRPAPPGLLLLAFAYELFANRARRSLRAAWRAANGLAAARLRTRRLEIIPESGLFVSAVERFAKRLIETNKRRKSYEKADSLSYS